MSMSMFSYSIRLRPHKAPEDSDNFPIFISLANEMEKFLLRYWIHKMKPEKDLKSFYSSNLLEQSFWVNIWLQIKLAVKSFPSVNVLSFFQHFPKILLAIFCPRWVEFKLKFNLNLWLLARGHRNPRNFFLDPDFLRISLGTLLRSVLKETEMRKKLIPKKRTDENLWSRCSACSSLKVSESSRTTSFRFVLVDNRWRIHSSLILFYRPT